MKEHRTKGEGSKRSAFGLSLGASVRPRAASHDYIEALEQAGGRDSLITALARDSEVRPSQRKRAGNGR